MIVTFAYLLYLIIPPKISKRPLEGIVIFKVGKLMANVDPNYPFTTKQNIFWEIWLLLLSTYCIVSYHNTFKNFFWQQIFKQGCIVLAQIYPKLPFPPKEIFLKKLTNITSAFHIRSCYIISKKSSVSIS